ncbi:hypothetical protein [Aeromonas hydrophila]|uniref:hypothetical protein n=1 Tax=Aeromonas hydrophila TaxID=644 RepID=UPI000AE066F6|nr:hypothetical protein [Aeromonas hydrophila]
MSIDIKQIRAFIGNGFFFSTVLGIYYFVVFAYYEKIPFPLDSSSLPTVFSSLGILGILLTGIFLFYSSMSIMIIADPLKIDYHNAFYTTFSGVKNKTASSIINYVLFFCSPLLFMYALFKNDYLNNITTIVFAIIPLLFSIHVLSKKNDVSFKDDKKKYLTKLCAHFATFFYLGFFSMLSYFIFYLYITNTAGLNSTTTLILASLIFLILNYIIILPQKKLNGFEVNANRYNGKVYLKTFINSPAAPIYLVGLIFSLTPSIAYKNTAKAFTLINAGGGIERSYYFFKNTPQKAQIPDAFIKECKADMCITNPLHVVLDINDTLYVRGDFEGYKNALTGLPRRQMQIIVPPKESQDE